MCNTKGLRVFAALQHKSRVHTRSGAKISIQAMTQRGF
jgi:hypothetical protein